MIFSQQLQIQGNITKTWLGHNLLSCKWRNELTSESQHAEIQDKKKALRDRSTRLSLLLVLFSDTNLVRSLKEEN